MVLGQKTRQGASHRKRHHCNLVGPRCELGIGLLGRCGPIRPAGRDHVFDGGAVAGKERQLDGEPGRGERIGLRPHRLRRAGEPVQNKHPERIALMGERLGPMHDGCAHRRMLLPRLG